MMKTKETDNNNKEREKIYEKYPLKKTTSQKKENELEKKDNK